LSRRFLLVKRDGLRHHLYIYRAGGSGNAAAETSDGWVGGTVGLQAALNVAADRNGDINIWQERHQTSGRVLRMRSQAQAQAPRYVAPVGSRSRVSVRRSSVQHPL
jgi:hypothetical protein